jgi:hypothetical protein
MLCGPLSEERSGPQELSRWCRTCRWQDQRSPRRRWCASSGYGNDAYRGLRAEPTTETASPSPATHVERRRGSCRARSVAQSEAWGRHAPPLEGDSASSVRSRPTRWLVDAADGADPRGATLSQ